MDQAFDWRVVCKIIAEFVHHIPLGSSRRRVSHLSSNHQPVGLCGKVQRNVDRGEWI